MTKRERWEAYVVPKLAAGAVLCLLALAASCIPGPATEGQTLRLVSIEDEQEALDQEELLDLQEAQESLAELTHF